MRSLLPREHGAYVQLLAPLVAALLAFGASASALLLATGACLAFVANEPLLVVLGHRGRRMRDRDGVRARRRLAVVVPAAAIAGIAGLALASNAARLAAAAASVPALLLLVLAWRRRVHSLGGELVAVVALTGAALPVAIAAGARPFDAAWLWVAWVAGFACTVVAVRRVIARHKRSATAADHRLVTAGVFVAVGITALGMLYAHARIALPLVIGSTAVLVIAPAATHLRTIGFALVGVVVVSVVFVVQWF